MIIFPTTSDRTCFFFFGLGGEGGSEISASLTSDASQKARPLSREHRMGIDEFNEKIESKMLRCDEKHTEKKILITQVTCQLALPEFASNKNIHCTVFIFKFLWKPFKNSSSMHVV